MSTEISWTDETWNPTTGCDRVSAGCDNCYALTMAARLKAMGQAKYQNDGDPRTSGPGFGLTLHPDALDLPLRWRKPRRVFVDSMSDLFHPDVPEEFIGDVFGTMGAAERHTFQILTKRTQRMAALLSKPDPDRGSIARKAHAHWWAKWFMLLDSMDQEKLRRATDPPPTYRIDNRRKRALVWRPERQSMPLGSQDLPWPLPNVWLGTSVENQRYADLRIPHLLATPAAVRFLSVEPLLGRVDIGPWLDALCPECNGSELPTPCWKCRGTSRVPGIDWVIVGGESGPGARPMEIEWAEVIVEQCKAAGVAVFVKQLGTVRGGKQHHDIDTFPESLRVREWPHPLPESNK